MVAAPPLWPHNHWLQRPSQPCSGAPAGLDVSRWFHGAFYVLALAPAGPTPPKKPLQQVRVGRSPVHTLPWAHLQRPGRQLQQLRPQNRLESMMIATLMPGSLHRIVCRRRQGTLGGSRVRNRAPLPAPPRPCALLDVSCRPNAAFDGVLRLGAAPSSRVVTVQHPELRQTRCAALIQGLILTLPHLHGEPRVRLSSRSKPGLECPQQAQVHHHQHLAAQPSPSS